MADNQLYPEDAETTEDLKRIQAAQHTLRRYHRRFLGNLQSKLLQIKGISLGAKYYR